MIHNFSDELQFVTEIERCKVWMLDVGFIDFIGDKLIAPSMNYCSSSYATQIEISIRQ